MMTVHNFTDFSKANRLGETTIPVSSRHNRFFSTDSGWYFSTREGINQGPFDSRLHAHEANQRYIREHQLSRKQ